MRQKCILLVSMLLICFTCSAGAAVDFDNFKVKWRFKTDGAVRADSVVDGDKVYVASTDGKLYALRKSDGKKLWALRTRGALAGKPLVANNLVIVVSRDNKVYAVNSRTGKVAWKFCMQAEQEVAKSGWKYFTAPPVAANGKVYVGSGDSNLYALDLRSGKLDWKFRTKGQIRAAPLVQDSVVYQPSNDGLVYVLGAETGRLHWTFATQGSTLNPDDFSFDRRSIYTTPKLVGSTLIIGSRDGNVYAIDTETHGQKWTFSYGSTWAMSTAVDESNVYVGWSTNNIFSAIDLDTGKEKWQFTAGSHNYTTGLITDSAVYFGSADGKLYQLDKMTGSKISHYDIGGEIYSSPVYDQETSTLFIGSDDGNLYAMEEASVAFKAVYQPANITDITQYLVVDSKVTPYLTDRGYEWLDSGEMLEQFIRTRISDRAPSVVVFALPIIPDDIMGRRPADGLIRQYLEAGGKVVWFGDPPNFYSANEAGNDFNRDAEPGSKLLDVTFTNTSESGNYFSKTTQEGENWGLPKWLKATGTPVHAKSVVPLALDEFGRISIWLKKFDTRPGSGYVSMRTWGWSVPIKDEDLKLIDEVAAYGLE